jgi:hypothetical protein
MFVAKSREHDGNGDGSVRISPEEAALISRSSRIVFNSNFIRRWLRNPTELSVISIFSMFHRIRLQDAPCSGSAYQQK